MKSQIVACILTDATVASVTDVTTHTELAVTLADIETHDYAAINITYTVTSTNNGTFRNSVSCVIPLGASIANSTEGRRFEMYSLSYGGRVSFQHTASDTFGVWVDKPSGTDTIDFEDVTIITYQSKTEVSPAQKQYMYNQADANADGLIDASDASIILSFYAAISTNQYTGDLQGWIDYCDDHNISAHASGYIFPDPNNDGLCDAVDASLVLSFYAAISVGQYAGTPDGWYQFLTDRGVSI